MNGELEIMRKEMVMANFKFLSQNFARTEENQFNVVSLWAESRTRDLLNVKQAY